MRDPRASSSGPSTPVDDARPGCDAIDERTLVVIDEAGMASTTDLAAVVELRHRPWRQRPAGRRRPAARRRSPPAGCCATSPTSVGAVTLTEVRRFHRPRAEAAATLAVRDGDPAALGFYADHGRIHVGDLATAADQAYAAWAADTAAGRHSILLAPTRDLVAELNTRARDDRLATGSPSRPRRTQSAGSVTRWPTGPRPRPVTPVDHPPQRPARCGSAAPTGSRTATAGPSPRSTADGSLTVRHQHAAPQRSGCPRTTSPPGTSSSATPPPSTAPRASPSTPPTPS